MTLRYLNLACFLACALGSAACSDESTPLDSGAGASGGSSGSTGTGGSSGGSAGAASGGSGAVGGSGAAGGAANAGGSAGTAGSVGAGGSAGTGTGGSAGTGGSGGSGGGSPSDEPFSFFVTSLASMRQLSQSEDGFGGDLTFGETGAGAGLRGADKICTAIAEISMPGNNKVWRAFLSATAGEDGQPVNAIDRIGQGPWYDRLGRLVAENIQGLRNARPTGGDNAIANDLPNEFGVPNNQPDPNQPAVDNHDILTGSNENGELLSMNAGSTCNDWTSSVGSTGQPRVGHSWPRMLGGPGFPGGGSFQSWISAHNTGGCAAGVMLQDVGGPQQGDLSVGAGGGYGGIYCFALTP